MGDKQAEAAPAVSADDDASKEREYVVLGELADGSLHKLGTQSAKTDKAAITPFALKATEAKEKAAPEDYVVTYVAYVAVPSRSFHRRTPRVPKQPRLSW